jgi:hypothetical protein
MTCPMLGFLLLVAVSCRAGIVEENRLPGTPDWLPGTIDYIWYGNNPGDLEGFTRDISSALGGRVDFSVNTHATKWAISIYRMGWYGGLGRRLIAVLPQDKPSVQPWPMTDRVTGLVDAGNWSVTATWQVPSNAVSGVYLAKLTRTDNNDQFVIPFVVRDDTHYHDIVFQTSDTTWTAYTGWGGWNLYGPNPGVAATKAGPAGEAVKVSYNRPFSATYFLGLAAAPHNSFFGAESATVRWLEENGYDVAYQSGVDTARYGVGDHRVFISCGHDEYWSGQQRANVEQARDRGVNLCFWSGNECYWRVRWENNYRTMVCYKETWAGKKIDPSAEWTGTWMDNEIVGSVPQNALTGQLYRVVSPTYAIVIPYPLTLHPIWASTQIASTAPGGSYKTVNGYLGYEWDIPEQNGYEPSVTLLSLSSYKVTYFTTHFGRSYAPQVATHSMTLYRAKNGALVFGAGTINLPWALDDFHSFSGGPGGYVPVDPNIQQGMRNLLRMMGVSPRTPQ